MSYSFFPLRIMSLLGLALFSLNIFLSIYFNSQDSWIRYIPLWLGFNNGDCIIPRWCANGVFRHTGRVSMESPFRVRNKPHYIIEEIIK